MPTFAAIDIGSNSCRLKIAPYPARSENPPRRSRSQPARRSPSSRPASSLRAQWPTPSRRSSASTRPSSFTSATRSASSPPRHARRAQRARLHRLGQGSATGWKVEVISGLEEGPPDPSRRRHPRARRQGTLPAHRSRRRHLEYHRLQRAETSSRRSPSRSAQFASSRSSSSTTRPHGRCRPP